MALRGTDPESYITEYTLVYEDPSLTWVIHPNIPHAEAQHIPNVTLIQQCLQ